MCLIIQIMNVPIQTRQTKEKILVSLSCHRIAQIHPSRKVPTPKKRMHKQCPWHVCMWCTVHGVLITVADAAVQHLKNNWSRSLLLSSAQF